MTGTSALVVVLMGLAVLGVRASYFPCSPCIGDECDLEPEDCRFGVVRDPCGRLVCAAGPGERCGGRDHHLGKCGEGMTCRCGICLGCSTVRLIQGHADCEWNNHVCTS